MIIISVPLMFISDDIRKTKKILIKILGEKKAKMSVNSDEIIYIPAIIYRDLLRKFNIRLETINNIKYSRFPKNLKIGKTDQVTIRLLNKKAFKNYMDLQKIGLL